MLGGKYRLLRPIGAGAMGQVYEAEQLSIDGHRVAVKLLDSGGLGANMQDEIRARLRREAQLLCQLRHPNTLRVLDFGELEGGGLFLVSELLEGVSLGELQAREGPLAPARAVRIVCGVLRSLAEAHALGIVHRDVKPQNVFLQEVHGESDFVKVLDFGIAAAPEGLSDQKLTLPGRVHGTPAYLSPEQAMGRPVTAQSDLYSVGAMLFELLSGRLPFRYATTQLLLRAHAAEPPPLVNADASVVSAELEALIARCLDKRPEGRPPSADALRAALQACPHAPEPEIEPKTEDFAALSGGPPLEEAQEGEPPPRSRRALWLTALAALALVVAFWASGLDPAPEPTADATEPAAETSTTEETGSTAGASVAPPPTEAAPVGVAAPTASPRGAQPATRATRREGEPSRVPVTVHASPAALARANDEPLGQTPALVWVPPGGTTTVTLQRSGYRTKRQEVSDEAPTVRVSLQRAGLPVRYK